MSKFLTSGLIGLTLSATMFAAAPVLAQSVGDQTTVRVSYSDLDITNAAGVAMLKGRLQDAVTQVCGDADNRDLDRLAAVKQCRSQTMALAESDLKQARLAALEGGGSQVIAVAAR